MESIWSSRLVQEHAMAVAIGMVCGGLLTLYGLYKLAKPKMLPGIPHNASAAQSVWGDLPSLVKHMKENSGILDWMTLECAKLNSPIIQLALLPFRRPVVIISDQLVAEDILSRRIRELDRSSRTGDLFRLVIPRATIVMQSHDEFKNKRRMWQGTMSPAFLHDVATPFTYSVYFKLVRLWHQKQRLARGRPFSVVEDIGLATADNIWAVAYGNELGAIQSQFDFLTRKDSIPLPESQDEPVNFPKARNPEVYTAIRYLMDSCNPNTLSSSMRNFFVSLTPTFRKHWNVKEREVSKLLQQSRQRFAAKGEKGGQINCAMDQVVEREAASYAKFGSRYLDDRSMKDETFAFLLGGFETVLSALQWALKHFSDNPNVQEKLQSALVAAFPASTRMNPPSVKEIMSADIPYLDATVHEVLRVGRVAGGVSREAQVDCEILGYHIPKGTEVIMSLQGDSFLFDDATPAPRRPAEVEALKRRDVKEFPLKGKRDFYPERWLATANGKQTFDPNAGSSMPFSTGLRGCFGKKLALIQIRIALALFTWSFHFEKVPDALNSYRTNEVVSRTTTGCWIKLQQED